MAALAFRPFFCAPFAIVLLPLLLALFPRCSADFENRVKIYVEPQLFDNDQLVYRFELSCGKHKPVYQDSGVHATAYIVGVGLENVKCLEGYTVKSAIFHNDSTKLPGPGNDELFHTWNTPHISRTGPFPTDKEVIKHHVKFANYFKLIILPDLTATFSYAFERPKMLYRVNVYCAGSDELQFKTYTGSETAVVLGSHQMLCTRRKHADAVPEYKLRVWQIRQEWIDMENTFDQPELVVDAVAIKNGTDYEMNFPTHFWLDIFPELDQGFVYYVEVECHGGQSAAAAETFRTFTDQPVLILLTTETVETAPNYCAKYDILVMKMNRGDAEKIAIPFEYENEHRKTAVTIKNHDKYEFDLDEDEEEEEHMEMEEDEVNDQPQQQQHQQEQHEENTEMSHFVAELAKVRADFEQLRTEYRREMKETKEAINKLTELLEQFQIINDKISAL